MRFQFFRGLALNLLALTLLIAVAAGAETLPGPKIAPAQLQADFQIFRRALEEGHSGLYRYTPKAEMDRAFDEAFKRLDHPMNAVEFYRVLARVVGAIKCGHTGVGLPAEMRKELLERTPLFPFDVEVLSGRVYISREYLPATQGLAGLEIKEINGVPISKALSTMLAATPGDADSQTGRPYAIGHRGLFPRDLYALLGIESPFEVKLVADNGTAKEIKVAGIAGADREKLAHERYPETIEPEDAAGLKFLQEGKVAVLTIHGFYGDVGQGENKKPLGAYMDDAFKQVHDKNSSTLIIDVRNNGGGEDDLGKKLLSFLLDRPFQYYDDLVLNAREFDFFKYVDGATPAPAKSFEKRADGKYHNITHPNLGVQQPSQPHFGGKVLVLMDGGSFSTTCEFLSNLHYHRRATLIGEEAGGGYYGNTSGRMPLVNLPNSKVRVQVPLQTYYLAVKGADPKRSILPDKEVKLDIKEIIAGKDQVMQQALKLAGVPAMAAQNSGSGQ